MEVNSSLVKVKNRLLVKPIADRRLAIDQSFRPAIVKKSVDECVLKCVGQMPVVAEKPTNYTAP
jgi:hypothetical protein